MAVTIKHAKTDNIADWTQADLDAQIALGNFPAGTVLADIVLPSDWNSDHTFTGTLGVSNGGTGATTLTGYVKGNGTSAFTASLTVPSTDVTGLGTMSTQNANAVAITGGTMSGVTVTGYIPTTDKGIANGVASLDGSGTVPVSQLPAAVLGALSYQGTWNASTNTPTLTSSTGTKGYYYVVNVAGSTNLNGITDWVVGDWAVYNGSVWQKVDNTDAVTSVNGYTGTVVLSYTDVGAAPATSGTSILYGNGSGGFSNVTIGTGVAFAGGTLSATGSGGNVVGPSSATDNAVARYDSTTGKLIQNSVVTIDDDGNIAGADSVQYTGTVPGTTPIGTMWFDSSTDTLNFKQNNITQQVGEELFIYGRASNDITDGQVIAVTGSYGTTGVVTFEPAPIGTTNASSIIGLATEPITKNSFGRITVFGTVHGLNTASLSDGAIIWYDPTVTGGYTTTKPSAPNIKVQVGIVTKAAGGTNGSIAVDAKGGSSLGGTDDNVQLSSPTAAQLLTYSTTSGYWKNTSLTAGTGITVGNAASGVITVTNSAPDQTVAITGTAPISVTGTYPNFTASISQATTSTNGYLSSTDWNTFNNKGSGTVTSVTGTAPVVSSGGATPAISMAAATGSVNGYLTSTDWTTFNNKGSGTVTAVSVTSANGFAGTSSGGATPALTLTTSITGVLKGNGTAISAATSGTDYAPATSGSSILYGNGSGGFSNVTVGTGLSFATGTLSSTVTAGVTVTNDTSTATALYPTFTSATSGSVSGVSVTSTKLNFTPSTGLLTAPVVNASNGIHVNSQTVGTSYTIPVGSSAMSAGPMTLSSGVAVTVSSGSRWVVL